MPCHFDQNVGGGRIPGKSVKRGGIAGVSAIGNVMTKGQSRITDGGFPVNPESARPPQGLVSGDSASRRTVFTDEGITGDWNIQEIGAAMKGRASVGQTGGWPDVNSARIQCNRDAQIRGILGLRLGVGSQEIVGVQ